MRLVRFDIGNRSSEVIWESEHGKDIYSPTVSPDGKRVYYTDDSSPQQVTELDLGSKQTRVVYQWQKPKGTIQGIAAGNQYVAVFAVDDLKTGHGKVHVLDRSTAQEIAAFPTKQ